MKCEDVTGCTKTATKTINITYKNSNYINSYNLCDEHAVKTKNELESEDNYIVKVKNLS